MPRTQIGAWKLFREALRQYRENWKFFSKLILIVALPVSLISTYLVDPSSDTALSSYLTFAQLTMSSALVYAIVQMKQGQNIGVKEAYYKGSGGLVRLILTAFALVVVSIVLIFGLLVLALGLLGVDSSLSVGEKLLTALASMILIVPGLYLMSRSVLSLYVIYETDRGPLQAIADSWRLTRGKGWRTTLILLLLIIYLLLVLLIPAGILLVLQTLTAQVFFLLLLQLVLALITVPLSNLYLYNYYQGLKS